MTDNAAYQAHQEARAEFYEARCRRCGACCGALERDPCAHLKKDSGGRYSCATYERRFGLRKTVSGREFTCVPVRQILFESWSGSWNCAYGKTVHSPWSKVHG